MRTYLFILFSAFFTLFSTHVNANLPITMNQGSAKALRGKVYVLVCYISDDDSWTKTEKDLMMQTIKKANDFLISQANKYQTPLEFEYGTFGYKEDIKFDKIEKGKGSGKERTDWVYATLSKVGYKTPLEFKKWVEKNKKANNFHVIIMAKGRGRSYALPANPHHANSEKYFVEGVVLYEKNFSTGKNLMLGTVAHETLHLYGAWDLYQTYKQTADRAKAAKAKFPKSIMVTILSDVSKQNVDELSAWLIGWHKDEKSWYRWFDPYVPRN